MLREVLLVVSPLIIIFGFVILFGAPYLPSKKDNLNKVLNRLKAKKEQRLIDLGSGDGTVLKQAAERGLLATGVELNPLLVLFAKFRLRQFRKVRVSLGNMWNFEIPKDADFVYVFLLPRFMKKLDSKMTAEAAPGTHLISFAFEIPGKKPLFEESGYFVYRYGDSKKHASKVR